MIQYRRTEGQMSDNANAIVLTTRCGKQLKGTVTRRWRYVMWATVLLPDGQAKQVRLRFCCDGMWRSEELGKFLHRSVDSNGEPRAEGAMRPEPPVSREDSNGATRRISARGLISVCREPAIFRSTWISTWSQRQYGTGPDDLERPSHATLTVNTPYRAGVSQRVLHGRACTLSGWLGLNNRHGLSAMLIRL